MSTKIRTWRKSSRSANQGNCVEACAGQTVLVRDSKLGEDSPILAVSQANWAGFLHSLQS